MDCACSLDSIPAEFHNVKLVVAKKEHRCGECGHIIQPGETYEYVFGKWGGMTDYYNTCLRCVDLRDLVSEYYGGCFYYECLFDHYFELLSINMNYEEAQEQVDRIRDKHRNAS